MKLEDSTRSALIRKGNELFNQKDIESAYRCYITASYFGGIEKIADYYNFEKKNIIKAMQLYRFIMKEDSNLGGNIRAKEKLNKLSEISAKVIRKWLKEDNSFNNIKNENIYNSNNYKKNTLEDILKAKEKLDTDKINNNFLIKENNIKTDFYSKNINIKKPVFEKIYKNKK